MSLHRIPSLDRESHLQLAVAGRVEVAFAVPETPALVGAAFHHQMVPMALDSTLAVTATDAVRLVIGTW